MKICIPIEKDEGLESPVSGHFGSAPFFLLVDVESLTCKALPNATRQPGRGRQIVALMEKQRAYAIVIAGIGAGALADLTEAGYSVFRTPFATVREAVNAFKSDLLPLVDAGDAAEHHDPRRGGSKPPPLVH